MTDEELQEIADLLTDGDIPLFDVPGYINQLYEGIERLLAEVARLQALISEEPRTKTLLPDEFQRLWQACLTLADKAEFKAVFRYLEKLEDDSRKKDAENLTLAEQKEALASELERERRRADGEENRAEVLRMALIDIANGADGIIVAKRVLTSDRPGLLAKYIDILQERLAKHSAALANAEKRIERLTYLTTDEDCYCRWCGSKRFNGHRDNCIAAEEE